MVQIADGIEQTWEGQIAVYTVTDLTDEALIQWSQSIIHTLRNWEANRFLALYDLSESGVSIPLLMRTDYQISPGLRVKGQDDINRILEIHPELRIYLAVLIPDSNSGNVMLARSQLYNTEQVNTTLFFDRDKALVWLDNQD